MSWFKHYLYRHEELKDVYMPLYLKPASNLVGAPVGSMSQGDVLEIHNKSADYTTGYVYYESKYQSRCLDVNASFKNATHGTTTEVFFPECSN